MVRAAACRLGGTGPVVRLPPVAPGSALVGRSASNAKRPPMEEFGKTANPKRFRVLSASLPRKMRRDPKRCRKEREKGRGREMQFHEYQRAIAGEGGVQGEGWNVLVLKMATWVPRRSEVVLAIL